MNKEANSSKSKSKKKKHHRHFTVLPYLTTPLIFVLISMIVIAPMCFVGMNFAVNTVHKVQETLSRDFNDVEAITECELSSDESGNTEIPELRVAQKLGEITCEKAGLYTDAYYGINRVSLRNGAIVDMDGNLCGMGGAIEVYGYASSSFKALNNVEIGDVISFETIWGKYSYKVVQKDVMQNVPEYNASECLVLATEKDKNAFSSYDKDKLYVVAEKLSGPNAKEVLV